MNNEEVRLFEKYHTRAELGSKNSAHRRLLQLFYKTSLQKVVDSGYKNPFDQESPKVLLCGTGSYATTEEFIRFAKRQNEKTQIYVIDYNQHPLRASQRKIDQNILTDVHFVQADALHLPFENNSFDLIETDFFIQFFEGHRRTELFKEWRRTLNSDGVITSRDWTKFTNSRLEQIVGNLRETILRKVLGPQSYTPKTDELHQDLENGGLSAEITPAHIPFLRRLHIPTMSYIIAHKKK